MPKGLTAATGMDALTHAIESYITPGAWVMSDMFELKAIEMIAKNLKAAVDNGSDPVAREAMSQAQYIAGMGFSNVGLGIVHSMAHPLGAHYDTPHGVATHCCCLTSWNTMPNLLPHRNTWILPSNGSGYYRHERSRRCKGCDRSCSSAFLEHRYSTEVA